MNIAVTRNPNQTPVKQPVPSFEDYTQKALSGREKTPEAPQQATLAPPNYTEMFGFDGQTAILRNTDIDGDGIAEDIYIYVKQKKKT